MPFEFEKTALTGAVIVKPRVFPDDRGFAMESYKRSDFMKAGLPGDFVQDNHSRSTKGVLRGLHYQRGAAAQGKLVRCSAGSILDVGVDIRKDSPTFGKWLAVELSATNARQIYLPPGFAHGFFALSDIVEVQYKCTAEYSPNDEAGIRWDDPALKIDWGTKHPILSGKDKALPLLEDALF
jgi:dTDP-4-dehydrorhamnose 3,5-epimerase